MTGLATAMMDSVPVLAITGQVALASLGTDAFQETDTIGITMPVTKHGFLVERAEDIPGVVAEAVRIATEGRPGPVLIDLPKDVQSALIEAGHPAGPECPGVGHPAGRQNGTQAAAQDTQASAQDTSTNQSGNDLASRCGPDPAACRSALPHVVWVWINRRSRFA